MEGTLEQQRVDMKAAAAADKRKIKELEVQGGSLRNELHHSQTRCTSMKAAHDSLHAEVRSLEGTVQQQRVDMKAAAAAAKQKIKELEVQGRSLRKELDHFETLCITLELENKRLHVDNNKLAGTVQQQRTEIKADKRKIEELGRGLVYCSCNRGLCQLEK
ncbi:hypothetical protein BDP27DRAFT_1419946 [Rhodocollybia butyracea]|uniref:Uncharacterized protein n=1 Tax=Rhodocollybia butyracea TaxID=206335 RepID=A0A9P5PW41_9AGAR|nr:hypothetical protein BDP27DRAFT_1419946 [Rhodocollybia butyracea]